MTERPSLEIRPVTRGDEAAWRPLWRDYLAFYKTERSEEVYRVAFDRLTGGAPGEFQGRLAWHGDRAVGLVHFLFHRHMWSVANTCYLQDLYAEPDLRGTGVGRALIEAVYAEAEAQGAATVYWLTQDDNATARQLYDRIGTLTPFIKYQRPAS